uniref:G_PROTEIN_RECEP_F1_2 domain-containing protein n=1 Tax=Heligmosomoides polygyrus TaxID=6339 RepID=A0A183F4H3_HELPZ
LAYFNIRIVKALTKHTKMTVCQLAGNALVEKAKRKATARAATRTLVMVVCCYLISNIISVALTIWEHLDKESLRNDYVNMYAIAIDLVSLLTTSACACRLPIYLTCQAPLRQEVKEVVLSWLCLGKRKDDDNEYLVMSKASNANSARNLQINFKKLK